MPRHYVMKNGIVSSNCKKNKRSFILPKDEKWYLKLEMLFRGVFGKCEWALDQAIITNKV